MRNFEHYITLFKSADTVGRELVARAIYAGRYGNADDPAPDVLRDLTRELPETLERDEALKIARASAAWREFLKEDPIPPWALRLGIQAAEMTQAALAERVGVSPRQVRRWLAGDQPCSGSSAVAARLILG